MHTPDTSRTPSEDKVSRLLVAAGLAGAGALAETLAAEARKRRHGHNRGRDKDDKKDDRDDEKDDRKEKQEREEAKSDASANDDNDDGGNNHDVGRVTVAAPPVSADAESRLNGKHDRPDDIAFVS